MPWIHQLQSLGPAGGILGRFAGPHALRQAVVAPILAFLFFNAFVAGLFDDATEPFFALANVALATIGAWGYFTVVGWCVNRLLPSQTAARSWAVAVVYASTELLRITVVFGLSGDAAAGSDYGMVFRLTAATTTGLVLFGLASVAVGDFFDYQRGYRDYAQRLTRLNSVLLETQSSIELIRAQFAMGVRRLVAENVTNAFKLGASKDSEHNAIAEELFRISDELVRPLSHDLSDAVSSPPQYTFPAEPPRVPFRTFLADATSVLPFQPVSLSIIVLVLTAQNLLLADSWAGVGAWILLQILVFGLSALGYFLVRPRLSRWPVWVRLLVITPFFAVPHMVYVVLFLAPGLPPGGSVVGFLIYGGILGALLGWLPAAAEGLRSSRARFVDALVSVDQSLAWSQVRAQSQLWLDQRRLALALHSEVQATILAAAMQLKNAVALGPEEAQKVLPKLERTIRQSLRLAHKGSQAPTLSSIVAKINRTWASLISLKLVATQDVIAALERDELALEVVSELIKELHLNSFKHGRASECVVTLTLASENSLSLHMHNNGAPLSLSSSQGLGENLLENVTLRHTARNVEGGVEIELDVPLEVSFRPVAV